MEELNQNRNLKWLHEFEEPYDGRLSQPVPQGGIRFCERLRVK
ncbi:MAG: hypothetical protein ACI8P3_002732, partial [Saprospiraceae bacterium]